MSEITEKTEPLGDSPLQHEMKGLHGDALIAHIYASENAQVMMMLKNDETLRLKILKYLSAKFEQHTLSKEEIGLITMLEDMLTIDEEKALWAILWREIKPATKSTASMENWLGTLKLRGQSGRNVKGHFGEKQKGPERIKGPFRRYLQSHRKAVRSTVSLKIINPKYF